MGLFQTKLDPQAAKIDALHFTNKNVISSQPRCFKSQKASARSHLWLPIGIVVRKLGDVLMDGDKYSLVETEYGLRTFIKDGDLSTMGAEFVYFFANGAADDKSAMRKQFCLGQSPCTAADYSAVQYLSPKSRYLAAEAKDFEALGYGGENFALQRIDPTVQWKCGWINVGIYAPPELTRKGYGRLNTCHEAAKPAGEPNLDKRIKVVRLSDYQAYFGKKIDAAVLRMDSGILEKIAPEFGVQKQCNQTLEFKSESELGVKAGLTWKPFAAVELGGSAAKKYLWSMREVLSDKVAVQVHAFNLETELAEARANAAPIQVRYSCDADASAPQKAREIRISHPLGPSGDFIFKIAEPGTKPASGDFGIDLSDKSQIYNQGYVWQITGQSDYFALRDTAFVRLRKQSDQVKDFYERGTDKLYWSRMTSFLAHLVLATAAKLGPEAEDEDEE